MNPVDEIRAAGGRVWLSPDGNPVVGGANKAMQRLAADNPTTIARALRDELRHKAGRMLADVRALDRTDDTEEFERLVEGFLEADRRSFAEMLGYRKANGRRIVDLAMQIDLDRPLEGAALFACVKRVFPDSPTVRELQELFG